jgi:hypothetical protein
MNFMGQRAKLPQRDADICAMTFRIERHYEPLPCRPTQSRQHAEMADFEVALKD